MIESLWNEKKIEPARHLRIKKGLGRRGDEKGQIRESKLFPKCISTLSHFVSSTRLELSGKKIFFKHNL